MRAFRFAGQANASGEAVVDRSLSEGNFHLRVAARRSRVHGCDNPVNVTA